MTAAELRTAAELHARKVFADAHVEPRVMAVAVVVEAFEAGARYIIDGLRMHIERDRPMPAAAAGERCPSCASDHFAFHGGDPAGPCRDEWHGRMSALSRREEKS